MESSNGATTSTQGPIKPPDSHSKGPLPLYDFHLQLLNNSYIGFFTERLKIEEAYHESITALHAKQSSMDHFYDEKVQDSSSVRRAWREVRDNLDRELQSHSAFLSMIKTQIIQPLTTLRDTHERSKKRIKEDVRSSAAQYTEFAENTLPRLKRSYFKRCQEIEEYRPAQSPPLNGPTSPILASPQPVVATVGTNPVKPSGPPITGAPHGRQPSVHSPPPRARSPSTAGNSLSDLAHQGKRQLNNLMTLIGDKGPTGQRAEAALKGVRAKREADEADKEYRKGVHDMETLRLRRSKILEAGYGSLESLVRESSATVQTVLERYADTLVATHTTNAQLSSSIRDASHQISPEKEASRLKKSTAPSLLASVPKPIYYDNYWQGPCKDLIIGISLSDYASERALREGDTPKLVKESLSHVGSRGMTTEGIYRISGKHSTVMELSQKLEVDEDAFEFSSQTDVHCIAGLLKLYLRELPEPLFRVHIQDRIQYTHDKEMHIANNMEWIKGKIRRLPPIHQATLRVLIDHLAQITKHSSQNRMDAKNLAVVFGPVVFGEDILPPGTDLLSMPKDTLMEDMITHHRLLYEDKPTSPPLPPAPLSQVPAQTVYGSSHTVVTSVPPSVASESKKSSPTTPSSSVVQVVEADFAPKLPPRPGVSIHPARKTGSGILNSSADQPPSPSPTSAAAQIVTSGPPKVEDGAKSKDQATQAQTQPQVALPTSSVTTKQPDPPLAVITGPASTFAGPLAASLSSPRSPSPPPPVPPRPERPHISVPTPSPRLLPPPLPISPNEKGLPEVEKPTTATNSKEAVTPQEVERKLTTDDLPTPDSALFEFVSAVSTPTAEKDIPLSLALPPS